jgi:uncharacterized Fe-S cluster-containing radical SAM superfamily protein
MSDQNTNEATKDVIVPATVPADTPVKFGFGQIGNATPQIINTIKRALNFFFGGAIIFLPAIASQFHTTTDNIASKTANALSHVRTSKDNIETAYNCMDIRRNELFLCGCRL